MTSGPLQKSITEIATAHPEVEFALVLARTINSISSDPEQLRGAIYELARQKLQAQLTHENASEAQRLADALEIAIQGVEAHSKGHERQGIAGPLAGTSSHRHLQAPNRQSANALAVIEEPAEPVGWDEGKRHPSSGRSGSGYQPEPLNREGARFSWARFAPLRYLTMIALFAAVLTAIAVQQRAAPYSAVRKAIGFPLATSVTDLPKASETPPPEQVTSLPLSAKSSPMLPTAYGIYAVSAGKLYELEMLQGRAPDARVAISAPIARRSETLLPNGHPKFVVFRRDSATNAPDLTEVRVIAKITQAITFDAAGKPIAAPTEDVWVIRNISFPYRAAPLKDNPDMYEVESRDPDMELPPGRYALVLKGQIYDFTVDGKITDKRQCLERVVAANGIFYSECQKP
jgi:hypothetical protein